MRKVVALTGGVLFSASLLGNAESEFQRWQQASMQQYQNFLSQQDQEFGKYLSQQWKEFSLFKGEKRDETPKPKTPPVAPVTAKPATDIPVVIPDIVAKTTPPLPPLVPDIPTKVKPAAPQRPKPSPAVKGIGFDYFGLTVQLPHNSIPAFADTSLSNESISNWWQQAAGKDHAHLLDGVRTQRRALSLSDWALYQLLKGYSNSVHPTDRNSRVAMQWFILTRLGFSTKIAYSNGQLILLLRTSDRLYETSYLEFDGHRYYMMDAPSNTGNRLRSYRGNHPDAKTIISMAQDMIMFNGSKPLAKRKLKFPYSGKQYEIEVDYHKSIIDYLSTIPPTDLAVYFNAPEAASLRAQLVTQLKPLLANLNQEQSVNLLLAFVQHAFTYATDHQQFGREHYMFADELFHYPSSDCEDRAVLFSHLVRELLKLQVVGVSYEGHVATAVHLPESKGRQFNFDGRTYVIADPTYVNARIGMEMPRYHGANAQLIAIR